MSTIDSDNIIYSPSAIELVTVGVEFCAFIENESLVDREEWISKMLHILPLLYIKISQLPEIIQINEELPETFVKEEDYARVTTNIASIIGEEDVYLDVFIEDMKYSDRPISSFVSEDIADIYQDIRNLISVYQYKLDEQMNDALFVCQQHFKTYWGQKLVNVIRPLHSILYNEDENEDFSDETETEINMEDLWD
ncbi:MAG: DUF5063 domain-containing protein [Proteiniphilum sp.]|nr:DUF5063 domain-containing protein [Proteiniphilum sp.]